MHNTGIAILLAIVFTTGAPLPLGRGKNLLGQGPIRIIHQVLECEEE